MSYPEDEEMSLPFKMFTPNYSWFLQNILQDPKYFDDMWNQKRTPVFLANLQWQSDKAFTDQMRATGVGANDMVPGMIILSSGTWKGYTLGPETWASTVSINGYKFVFDVMKMLGLTGPQLLAAADEGECNQPY